MSSQLDEALLRVLTPMVKKMVEEEVARAGFEWRWKTPSQAGEVLGISADAVRKRARSGELPATFEENGRILIDMREYDRRLRERQ